MIDKYIIDYSIAKEFEIDFLKEHNIFPIMQQSLFILIASSNPIPNELLLSTFFKKPLKFIIVSNDEIQWQIKYFNNLYTIFDLGQNAILDSEQDNINNSYIINMVDKIILFAIKLNSSDIHIESLKNSMIIRFRIDGILYLILTLDLNIFPLIATILKLFSNLDISQIRLPQNGRFTKILDKKEYDFRLSTIPIIDGESLVLRVLDNKNSKITLDKIGFDKYIFKALNKIINLNQGLILVTGPTGSGKTTSMYAMLNTLNTNSKKIITVEDPVEYNLDGIQQININEDLDLTYSYALKSILRQDPDIIMIGEIRDEEALKIAIQAALTGHLVIATLHTNNAPDTINRLLDLNAEPFLIASTLKAVISQRLIRKLCNNCKDNQAKNCEVCNNTRYQGRINICELLECDKTVSNMIANSDSIPNIIKYVTTKNYITLEQNCLNKVKNGITSMEEYYSKIQSI